jgi:hypothetical protein
MECAWVDSIVSWPKTNVPAAIVLSYLPVWMDLRALPNPSIPVAFLENKKSILT